MAAKDDFAKGCRDSGGSFIENPDGTYQCNTTSGIRIKCQSDGQRCWIAAQVAEGLDANIDVAPIVAQPIFDLPVTTGVRPRSELIVQTVFDVPMATGIRPRR